MTSPDRLPPACLAFVQSAHTERRLETIDLIRSPMILGRTSGADIVVPDLLISRRHARLTFAEGSWWLSDESSTGGIYIDASRLIEPHRLVSRERFKLGTVEFHLLLGDVESELRDLIFRLSSLDPTTSSFNAAYFCQRLEALCDRDSNGDFGISLAMLSIDRWPQHADRLGSYLTAQLRIELARLIENELGGGRMVGVIGDSAFVIAFPNESLKDVSESFARLLTRTNDTVFLRDRNSWRIQLRGTVGVYRAPLRAHEFLSALGRSLGLLEDDLRSLSTPISPIELTLKKAEHE